MPSDLKGGEAARWLNVPPRRNMNTAVVDSRSSESVSTPVCWATSVRRHVGIQRKAESKSCAREAPFHVLQEKMAGFWNYRTDPK